MSFYFDWRPGAVYTTLQSHEWFRQDCACRVGTGHTGTDAIRCADATE